VQEWPAAAIQDTVAAIISQRPYQRSLRRTLLERLYDWFADLVRRIFSEVSEIPNAKWIVLGVAVLAVSALVLRFWLGGEAEMRRRRARRDMIVGGGDPWADAERLAKAGDYTEAAHLLYRGVIDRLAANEQVRIHSSKTSGDYARDLLRKGSAAHGEFRQFGRRYDRVLFDLGVCDAETYAALRDHATRVIELFQRKGRAA
jgi:hypothetical protein